MGMSRDDEKMLGTFRKIELVRVKKRAVIFLQNRCVVISGAHSTYCLKILDAVTIRRFLSKNLMRLQMKHALGYLRPR